MWTLDFFFFEGHLKVFLGQFIFIQQLLFLFFLSLLLSWIGMVSLSLTMEICLIDYFCPSIIVSVRVDGSLLGIRMTNR